MSSSSDSEEFYDAEEKPNSGSAPKPLGLALGLGLNLVSESTNSSTSRYKHDIEKSPAKVKRASDAEPWRNNLLSPTKEEIKEAQRKATENERRRRRVEENRRRLLTEEEDIEPASSGQSSKASSLDGVYPSSVVKQQQQHRLAVRNDEGDQGSIISLGKVGSLLGDNLSLDSRESLTEPCQKGYAEPDLVASTKCSNDAPPVPVAPPRTRRKNIRSENSIDLSVSSQPEPTIIPQLPSPTSAVESIAQELEFSLNLRSATKGDYVVKPQDFEKNRAPTVLRDPEPEVISNLGSGSSNNDTNPPSLDLASLQLSGLGINKPKGNSLSRSSRGSSKSGSLQEDSVCQMNIVMRTRSDSGRPLTDLEILEQVTVLNLDTGEQIPLSQAEDHLPKGINPLSLHLMRLTSEYVSTSSLDKYKDSDDEGSDVKKSADTSDAGSLRKKTSKLKNMIGKTVHRIRTVADEVYHAKHSEEIEPNDDDAPLDIKFKASSSHKGPYEFDNIRVVQELPEHAGAIWTMKFSVCGRMLASAGQDHKLRIWVLKDAFSYFDDMRQKYNAGAKVSPTPSQESLASQKTMEDLGKMHYQQASGQPDSEGGDDNKGPFMSQPICTYEGHTADVLDLSWSKNHFILSSSMDKTVRLWHISRRECLCCFQHSEFVTAIAFHPRDDRYFLSGSLDGRLRLWNIPDKKVAVWNEVEGQSKFITAVNFCQNGRLAVIGSYDGRCVFYITEQLKYHTQIHVRSSRGKNAKGRKISGIEPVPGGDKILIASNDSRIRLYDLRDQSLACKYKGYVNQSSQNRASFSADGKYIISGSENHFLYIWKTQHDISKFSSARRDRNDYWEGIKAHNAVVTAAVFAPFPILVLSNLEQSETSTPTSSQGNINGSYVFVSADFNGCIKVFAKKKKCKGATLSTAASLPS